MMAAGPPEPVMGSGIAREGMDPRIRPQDDLFGYANGRWVAETEIPEDRARHGTFNLLADAAELQLREIVEADDGKVGALYAGFMDEAAVDALGVTPLAGDLDAIAAIETPSDLLHVLGSLQRHGVGGLFMPFVDTDARASDAYIVYLEQAGLGLPDESYYRDDKPRRGAREKYVALPRRRCWVSPTIRTRRARPPPTGCCGSTPGWRRRHWERAETTRDVQRRPTPS